MKPQLKILLKKELYEFRYNYKAWLAIIICIAVVYVPTLWTQKYQVFTASFFILLAVGQYIYNSYSDEINSSGSIFIHNLNFSFLQVFFIKIFFSFVIAALMLIADIPNISKEIKIIDFLWLSPLIIAGASIMQLSGISSKGSEDTSSVIMFIVSFIMLTCVMLIQVMILRILTCMFLAVLSVYAAYKVSYSLKYRTQL
ncbi:hypothetical protein [Treponema pedis]|uniref:ABC transporter permease n=3 Tax=Treponema pedis TaxID=409322 RepID=S6A0S9_9SPIR|nr:hypothetical protein [Treponema pedis]AGT44348.1 hypothetical protein TPE_1874 [Treponema pedis str. T A4]